MSIDDALLNTEAPDFAMRDQEGNRVLLRDYRDKQPVLLVFYPGDDTPGCIKQLCAIRDDWEAFRGANVAVFGINNGSAESHLHFWGKHGLKTPLLVDENNKVSRLFGATQNLFKSKVIKRSVVLIDKDGIIRYIKRGLPPDSEILKTVKELA